MYDKNQRLNKARKIAAVISDHVEGLQGQFTVLDVGCSTGIMTHHLAEHFKATVGVDIDSEALQYASTQSWENLGTASFLASDAMCIPFRDNSFDAVVCAHVYEHVPNAKRMMNEIYRVLKPGGICFFSAGNRLSLMEPHYRLPFLSIVPKPVADWFLRGLGRGDHYYEKHLTYWGLKALVSRFELIDYTQRIVDDPERFAATDVCPPGSGIQRFASLLAKTARWLIPTYIFLLKKAQEPPP